eukprot:360501-Chlamydomonas_euryale.AAC.1
MRPRAPSPSLPRSFTVPSPSPPPPRSQGEQPSPLTAPSVSITSSACKLSPSGPVPSASAETTSHPAASSSATSCSCHSSPPAHRPRPGGTGMAPLRAVGGARRAWSSLVEGGPWQGGGTQSRCGGRAWWREGPAEGRQRTGHLTGEAKMVTPHGSFRTASTLNPKPIACPHL